MRAGLTIFFWLLFLGSAAAGENTPVRQLHVSELEYHFVGHLEEADDEGRLLVWKADVDGDISGTMRWWFVDPSPAGPAGYSGGELTFYKARWEISIGDEIQLAGESSGKTDFRGGEDGVWDGHGVVTETNEKYENLLHRKIYETGTVLLGSEPPVSFTGRGLFVVY